MKTRPFWKTTGVMLRDKRLLALSVFGLLVSTACFGAGLGLLMYVFKLLMEEQRTLRELALDWVDRQVTQREGLAWLSEPALAVVERLPHDPFYGFIAVTLTIGVLSVIGSMGRYLHESGTVTIAIRGSRVWRQRLFARLIHAPVEQVLVRGTGDHISRLIADTNHLATGYQSIMGKAVAELLKGAVALGLAFAINWKLTALALIGAPIVGVLLRKFAKRIRRSTKRAMRHRGSIVSALKQSLGGISVVKVHNAEGYERRQFARLNRELLREQLRSRRARALAGPVIDTMALLGVILVASTAAWLIYRQNEPAQELVYVLALLAVAGGSLKPLSSLNNELSEATAAAERILEAASLPVEPTGREAPDPASLTPLPRHRRSVLFERVTYRYPDQAAPAVNAVDLSVQFGQTIAIVGGNGAGKSTLLSLLPRLLAPQSGRVLIDGVDIANVSLRRLREQIAVVTQQTVLFRGTIAENIAYGRRHVPREPIVAAAGAAFADEFIDALPEGYDTKLGEDGTGLSGGQRQRLSIARAILRDPAILILDEATSQIDADSEAKISSALREFRQGRTTFIIAHRLSTVIDADCIVVMDAGQIVDQGRHAELLERCAIYRTLARTQLQPVPA